MKTDGYARRLAGNFQNTIYEETRAAMVIAQL